MVKAVLVVRIEQVESIPLNEFFDYNGHCYGLTCRRDHLDDIAMDFEDFYEETIGTSEISGIEVYFVQVQGDEVYLYGWYENANIYRRIQHPSMFLEGNVVAAATDVVLMEHPKKIQDFDWYVGGQVYEVIEAEDVRHGILSELKSGYKGKNLFQRFPYIHVKMQPRVSKSYEQCILVCQELAGAIMQDSCGGIAELAELRAYAKQASELNRGDADGFYYLAMACYQLGFLKEAMKAVERALQLEPEASDILAQKGAILVSMGHLEAGKELFQKAYEQSGDESYLI